MLKLYRDCDSLPIYNFYKILETDNFQFLCVDYDGYKEVKLDGNEQDIWNTIYEEYVALTNDNTTRMYYELVQELMYLQSRYKVVSTMLQNMTSMSINKEILDAYILELKKWGFKIKRDKNFGDEVLRMVKQLKASEMRIKLKETELNSLKEQSSVNEKLSLTKQKVKLEQALDRDYIDVKKVSVSEWIALLEQLKEINQAIKKRNGK